MRQRRNQIALHRILIGKSGTIGNFHAPRHFAQFERLVNCNEIHAGWKPRDNRVENTHDDYDKFDEGRAERTPAHLHLGS